jgi:hydroxyethylthiazole kinase-like uncharacterized protein yjeF
MKIFSVQQIREADKYTMEQEPISSIDLMERAATAVANEIEKRYGTNTTFKIVCGLGNNGADGLAVARLLHQRFFSNIEVYIVRYSDVMSDEFKTNLTWLNTDKLMLQEITKSEDLNLLRIRSEEKERKVIYVDALLGTGLNRPAEGLVAEVIQYLNQQPALVISIDIPSGLYCDELNHIDDSMIKADYTFTFQFPKLSFMFPETADCVGEFNVLEIGIHNEYINSTQTKNYFITKSDITQFFKARSRTAHKGNFGHALIVAGSYGKMGAAVLSAKGCLKAGVGLLTVHIPGCGYSVLQTSVPEAMVDSDSEMKFVADNIRVEKYHAVGMGPGIGTEKQTQNVVKLLIQNSSGPLVLDADAINCIAENKTWLSFVPADSIFTPHPKEFERLTEKAENSVDRLKIQREFSMKYNVYVILKGAHTSISCPDGNIHFNSTGNPGMATGGSGDVLTGVITSLLAQGYTSLQSCILGVYLHGLAGDFAAHELSEESMIASDIVEQLANAYKFIKEPVSR